MICCRRDNTTPLSRLAQEMLPPRAGRIFDRLLQFVLQNLRAIVRCPKWQREHLGDLTRKVYADFDQLLCLRLLVSATFNSACDRQPSNSAISAQRNPSHLSPLADSQKR